jgi:hypothetical protein
LTDKKGAFLFNELFKDCCIQPVKWSKSDTFSSYFGKFEIRNILVEIMGNLEIEGVNSHKTYSTRLIKPEMISIAHLQIPVSSLESQFESYRNLNREKDTKRIRLIEEALKKKL